MGVCGRLTLSKVHPCQEHHQRNLSGGDEHPDNCTQLPSEWLRSLLGFWEQPWQTSMSRTASKFTVKNTQQNTVKRHRWAALSAELCGECFG